MEGHSFHNVWDISNYCLIIQYLLYDVKCIFTVDKLRRYFCDESILFIYKIKRIILQNENILTNIIK